VGAAGSHTSYTDTGAVSLGRPNLISADAMTVGVWVLGRAVPCYRVSKQFALFWPEVQSKNRKQVQTARAGLLANTEPAGCCCRTDDDCLRRRAPVAWVEPPMIMTFLFAMRVTPGYHLPGEWHSQCIPGLMQGCYHDLIQDK
jgi:hypothetical protein